eukprot:gnl/TRDRNA2_/TRDRNA2_155962_c0_seq1.p1 gnl/TRDRNA2_/TRDRNA2_155962_c0~~gnl/TRDRNA2_/TRDRNA2_155962_c0_seq1.p1  ORF type:complete len:713 (-),score=84.74 gnl/TRDRNA2_/TRDRNA2_155962_c0_seq1:352-2328(-)
MAATIAELSQLSSLEQRKVIAESFEATMTQTNLQEQVKQAVDQLAAMMFGGTVPILKKDLHVAKPRRLTEKFGKPFVDDVSTPSIDRADDSTSKGLSQYTDGDATTLGKTAKDAAIPSKWSSDRNARKADPSSSKPAPHPICARNTKILYVWQIFVGLFLGLVQGPTWDKFLYLLSHGLNVEVGALNSVSGLTSVCCCIPVGLAVDHRPGDRARLCKISAYLGFVSAVVMTVAVLLGRLSALCVGLVPVGMFAELAISVTRAVGIDSLEQDDRAKFLANQAIILFVMSAVGPAIISLGFLVSGDQWSMGGIKMVIIGAYAILFVACVSLMFLRDPPLTRKGSKLAGENQTASSASSGKLNNFVSTKAHRFLRPWQVPYILTASNLVKLFGAGMTVRFLNLWLINDVGLSAAESNWVAATSPLITAVFTKILNKVQGRVGRAQASLAFTTLSIATFVGLYIFRHPSVALPLYFLLNSFRFAVYPLDQSIIADFTLSSQRGRWQTVQSLSQSSFSFSAVVGGHIADLHGYHFTFLITGMIYALAVVMYSPLLILVPAKKATQSHSSDGAGQEKKAATVEEGRRLRADGVAPPTAVHHRTTLANPSESLVAWKSSDSIGLIDFLFSGLCASSVLVLSVLHVAGRRCRRDAATTAHVPMLTI